MTEQNNNPKNKPLPSASKKTARAPATKKSGKPSGNHGAEVVALFRQDNIKRLFWAKIETIGVIGAALALVLFAGFSVVTSKQVAYFQLDNTGRAVPLVPLTNPKHGDAFIQSWLEKCVVGTFDFYYKTMDKHLTQMKGECYNDAGYASLINGLKNSGNYDAIKDKELFSTFSFKATPMVVRKKSDGQTPYRWLVQGEGTLTLSTKTKNFPNKMNVTAVVERASLLEDNIGLSIEKILFTGRAQ